MVTAGVNGFFSTLQVCRTILDEGQSSDPMRDCNPLKLILCWACKVQCYINLFGRKNIDSKPLYFSENRIASCLDL